MISEKKSTYSFFLPLLVYVPMVFLPTILFAQHGSSQNSVERDSLLMPKAAYHYIRGIERDEKNGFNPIHSFLKLY